MAEHPQKISAIVLAAGSSQRMGSVNKLHLDINGTSMLQHTINVILASNIGEVVVVLGHEYERTKHLLDGLAVRTVYNAHYVSGPMSSVHCGLAALQQADGGILIALADQPTVTAADINFLIEAYINRSEGEVVVPTYQGKRGNPIIISNSCRQDILAGKHNFGCRQFISNHPELVKMVAMSTPAVTIDLDTQQEYQNYYVSPSEALNDGVN